MKHLLFGILAIMPLQISCIQEGLLEPLTTVSFASQPYDELKVSNALKVTVSDTARRIYVTCAESIAERVKVNVREHTLYLGLKAGTRTRQEVQVVLPRNKYLCEVELSGASSFMSDDTLSVREVAFSLSGASTLHAMVLTDELDVDMSGASVATVEGKAAEVDMDLKGASTLEGIGLTADQVKAELSGASKASINCNTMLEVEASGASTLIYGGSPYVKSTSTGGSTIKPY